MVVADASVTIGHLRDDRRCTTVLRRHLGRGDVLVPSLVAFEGWKGARPSEQGAMEELFGVLRQDPFTPAMARLAADLHQRMAKAGSERPPLDLLIASHALYHGPPLATLDRDDRGIEGLDMLSVRREA